MAVHATRPTTAQLRALAQEAATDELTYSSVGISTRSDGTTGYRYDRWTRDLGHGRPVFERASAALHDWRMHTTAGLSVADSAPPTVGAVVAMAAPLPVGYIDAVCRVVAVDDRSDRFGFTYGTLQTHPEQGEESFSIVIVPDGRVTVDIIAVSRLRHPFARAFPPVARWLQRMATNRYLDAIQSLANG